MPVLTTVGAALAVAQVWDGHMKFLAGLRDRFAGNKPEAMKKLDAVLDEIDRTCTTFESLIARFASLHDRPSAETLTALTSGGLLVEFERGRGHCQSIKIIFRDHLDGWLSRTFSSEHGQLKSVFEVFEQGDTDLFWRLEQVATELQGHADDYYERWLADQQPDVAQIKAILRELLPVRREVAQLWRDLRSLRNSVQLAFMT